MSLPRLLTRVALLEAACQAHDAPRGQGLAAGLAAARHLGITTDHSPLASLTEAELDAKVIDLSASVAAGARGLTPLLLEVLEKERERRQTALAYEPSARCATS